MFGWMEKQSCRNARVAAMHGFPMPSGEDCAPKVPPGWGSSDGRSAGNAIDRGPQRASAARPTTTVQFTMLSARRTVDANLLIPLGPAVECRKCAHRCHRELAILRLARLR